ncbi:MAG: hypothetical protein ACQEXV_22560 [Bacillota bacterium]
MVNNIKLNGFDCNLSQSPTGMGARYAADNYKGYLVLLRVCSTRNKRGLGGGRISELSLRPIPEKLTGLEVDYTPTVYNEGNWRNGYIPPIERREVVESIVQLFDPATLINWSVEEKKTMEYPARRNRYNH